MKIFLLALAIMALPFSMQAQFGNLLERAKSKVNNRINNKIDQGMDKALDKAESDMKKPAPGTKKTTGGDGEETATEDDAIAGKAGKKTAFTSNSKFDFVPGEKVIYSEEFAHDVIGELPMSWNASGKGEVQTINGKQGKWMRLFQNNTYLSGNKSAFGENYTVEFDMIYYYQPKAGGYVIPGVSIGLMSTGDEDNLDNKFLRDQVGKNSIEVTLTGGIGAAHMTSYKERTNTFNSDRVDLGEFAESYNKVLHYAIQVQKTRFRMWINQTKVFDVPRGANPSPTMNQLYFQLEGSNYKEDEIGAFLTNLKVATGLPDTRHKLINEGKFSTTGILFDFQSAVIKPESYGVIKEIGNVLKENPTVKINVVGHTSNDGDANANLALSKLRSAAVKEILVKEFGIDPANITTDGKGGTQPVGDNKTTEGKTQNRRVEFIKI